MRGEKWGWGEGEEVGGSKEGRGYLHICPYILLILPSHISHMSLTHSHTCHTCPLHTHTRVTHVPYTLTHVSHMLLTCHSQASPARPVHVTMSHAPLLMCRNPV